MKVYTSTYPPPRIPTTLSLSQFITRYNPDGVLADKVVLEDDWTGKQLTYGKLRQDSAKHAYVLKQKFELGVGDVVGISGVNSVHHVQLIHAVLWTGATAALMNALSTTEDFVLYFSVCRPKLVFVDTSLLEVSRKALSRVAGLASVQVIILGDSDSRGLVQFPKDFEGDDRLPIFDLKHGDNRDCTAVVCFSSGTSGKPKGVELSHYNLIASIAGVRATDPAFYNSDNRGVFFAPLCHIYGLQTVALTSMWLGAYVILMKKYTLDGLMDLSSRIRANTLRLVPPIALAIAKSKSLEHLDLSSMKFILCSGASLPKEVIEVLQKRLNNAPIFQGYGMSETNIATLRSHEAFRVGSVGRLFADVQARLVDDDMNDVETGVAGELLIRSPSLFRRYMNNPESTAEAFHQGWFRTGDVLRIDEEGYFYLIDRKKELIKYKGLQVAPAELEGVLVSHPFVNEGVVCATWDDSQVTEVPMAYVTLTHLGENYSGGKQAALREIEQFANAKVSPYKRLRGGVEVLDEIPKTASGKILRRMLPARLALARTAKL